MKIPVLLAILVSLTSPVASSQDRDTRIADLDKKLAAARETASALQKTIDSLATELASLRQPENAPPSATALPGAPAEPLTEVKPDGFKSQILRPDLGGDERDAKMTGRPGLFIQSRYQNLPIAGTTIASAPSNFVLTRMESRWSGRLSDKVGMGFELQYHPAPMGAAAEIVNDAFVEYYPSEQITIRAGQFVKPFGFDVQQSSSIRESPERGMFAGYFFPGQRDRGVLVSAKLDSIGAAWKGAQIYAGLFNGNRFFVDNNRQLNYNVRFRKVLDNIPLAIGVSAQLGRQIFPVGMMVATTSENLYGADVQWAWRRFGIRGELMGGDMPSTLVSLQSEFTPRFRPGAHSVGGAVFTAFALTRHSQIYARYDQFNGDPVSGQNVRAFNFGYLRKLGEHSRVAADYQFKNRPSFNDDFVNTRFQIVWNVVY